MNFEDAITRLQAAQGDPQKLTLATVDIVLAAHESGLRSALEAASVPHWFTPKILAALMQTDEPAASCWWEKLRELPMVEPFSARGGCNVHEATRRVLRAEMVREPHNRLRELSDLARECFGGDEPHQRVEAIYHRLVAAPNQAADELEQLWKGWDEAGNYEPLQALGVALQELIGTDQLAPLARARSLVCFGWIPLRGLPLRKAEGMAREAVKLFRELGHEHGEMDARSQLGGVLTAKGDLAGALSEYYASHQIARRLTQRNPDNTVWQRELSVSHNYVGRVYQARGQLSEALLEFEAHKQIMLRLTERDTDNSAWQRDLSVSHHCVGSVYQAQGRLSEALREFEASKQIMLRLTQHDPENSDWQRGLSVSHNYVGSVCQAQGRLSEALREFEASKQIMLRLTQHDPDNFDWQRDLSVSHNYVGSVYQAQGRLSEALREFEAYKQIMLRLTHRDPDNTDWQRDLSVSHNCIGAVYQAQGRPSEALREFEAGFAIAERLATDDPTNAQWQKDVAETQGSVDRLRKELGCQP